VNDGLHGLRAGLRLVRRLAMVRAGMTPEPDRSVEALAEVDDAPKELDTLEEAGPSRAFPGRRGRHGR